MHFLAVPNRRTHIPPLTFPVHPTPHAGTVTHALLGRPWAAGPDKNRVPRLCIRIITLPALFIFALAIMCMHDPARSDYLRGNRGPGSRSACCCTHTLVQGYSRVGARHVGMYVTGALRGTAVSIEGRTAAFVHGLFWAISPRWARPGAFRRACVLDHVPLVRDTALAFIAELHARSAALAPQHNGDSPPISPPLPRPDAACFYLPVLPSVLLLLWLLDHDPAMRVRVRVRYPIPAQVQPHVPARAAPSPQPFCLLPPSRLPSSVILLPPDHPLVSSFEFTLSLRPRLYQPCAGSTSCVLGIARPGAQRAVDDRPDTDTPPRIQINIGAQPGRPHHTHTA
ncbi:hypothetical protein B0H10DRAFT_2215147 [Mycena sp. CBHHK59/15]|nr:hypothetical protein B0H10DRAFT_2215147 [Mycena sp. CBHHK59/15]